MHLLVETVEVMCRVIWVYSVTVFHWFSAGQSARDTKLRWKRVFLEEIRDEIFACRAPVCSTKGFFGFSCIAQFVHGVELPSAPP